MYYKIHTPGNIPSALSLDLFAWAEVVWYLFTKMIAAVLPYEERDTLEDKNQISLLDEREQ